MNILSRMRKKAQYTPGELAKYLAVSTTQYEEYEGEDILLLPYSVIEKMAALYHVSEYDILTGKAKAHSLTGNVRQETEIIPFISIVNNYMLMSRLLDDAPADDPHYQIAWNNRERRANALS